MQRHRGLLKSELVDAVAQKKCHKAAFPHKLNEFVGDPWNSAQSERIICEFYTDYQIHIPLIRK